MCFTDTNRDRSKKKGDTERIKTESGYKGRAENRLSSLHSLITNLFWMPLHNSMRKVNDGRRWDLDESLFQC